MCRWGSLQSGPSKVNMMIYHQHLLGCSRTESEADPLWCEMLGPQLIEVSQFCLGSPHGEIKQRWQLLPVTVLNAEKDLLNPHDNQSFSLLQLGKLRLSSQDWTARKGRVGIHIQVLQTQSQDSGPLYPPAFLPIFCWIHLFYHLFEDSVCFSQISNSSKVSITSYTTAFYLTLGGVSP